MFKTLSKASLPVEAKFAMSGKFSAIAGAITFDKAEVNPAVATDCKS